MSNPNPRGNRPFYESVTPDQLATAVRRIRGGAPLDSVLCAEFGCSDRAARRFRAEGKRVADMVEDDGAELTPREKKALELWTAINKAWYEAELFMLDEIRKAEKVTVETTVETVGKSTITKVTRRQVIWPARAWILERTRREIYALNQAPFVDLAAPTPAGPTPGTPEHEAALIEALAAKPDLLRRAVEAAEKRGQK